MLVMILQTDGNCTQMDGYGNCDSLSVVQMRWWWQGYEF